MASLLAATVSVLMFAVGTLVLPIWLPFTGFPLVVVCFGLCIFINSNALRVPKRSLRPWFRVMALVDTVTLDMILLMMAVLLVVGNAGDFRQALLAFSITAAIGIALTIGIPRFRTVRGLIDAARGQEKPSQQ